MRTKILITESQYEILLQSLNEQIDLSSKTYKLPFKTQKAETFKFAPSNTPINVELSPEEINSILNSDVSLEMVKLMDTYSKRPWVRLKQTNPKYAAAVIKKFEETFDPESPWSRIVVKQLKSDVVKTKSSNTIPGGDPTSDSFKFPLTSPENGMFFVDNEWILTSGDNGFTGKFKVDVIDKIVEKMKTTPNVVGKPVLKSLNIETSCSTLPNGPSTKSPGANGKVLSFLELSKNRNNAAKNYVIGELQKIGVTINPDQIKLTQTFEGSVGDGTTVTNGNVWKKPNTKTGKPSSTNRSDYERDKYLRINLDVVINTKSGDDTKPITTNSASTVYNLVFDVTLIKNDEFAQITLPRLTRRTKPKTQQYCKPNKNGKLECEDFGSGDNWWDELPFGS